MKHLKIIVWSDLHRDLYTNGLTEEDCGAVEEAVTQELASPETDFCIFNGDKYVHPYPKNSVRNNADAAMVKMDAIGKPVINLVGNHDRERKSVSSDHVFLHTKIYPNDLKHIIVLDQVCVHNLKIRDISVNIYAVPAGHGPLFAESLDNLHKNAPPADFNICLFHDIIKNSMIGAWSSPRGLDISLFDKPYFDIVLGGDNHTPQQLPFTNTKGCYIGAPLQHNFGDAGQDRGFIILDLYDNRTSSIQYHRTNYPKFVKLVLEIPDSWSGPGADTPWIDALIPQLYNTIAHVTIKCSKEIQECIDLIGMEALLKSEGKARKVKCVFDIALSSNQAAQEPAEASTNPMSDWSSYVEHIQINKDLDREKLKTLGLSILENV